MERSKAWGLPPRAARSRRLHLDLLGCRRGGRRRCLDLFFLGDCLLDALERRVLERLGRRVTRSHIRIVHVGDERLEARRDPGWGGGGGGGRGEELGASVQGEDPGKGQCYAHQEPNPT